ncbi:MAG: carboxypeptidase-like regulatory domain-containing protein, partial [Smithella sp.]
FVTWSLSGSVLLSADSGSACGSPKWYWNGSQYTNAKNFFISLYGSGVSPENWIWWQGYSDGAAGVSQANYLAGLNTLTANIASDFPGSKFLLVYNDNAGTNVNAAFTQAISSNLNGITYAGADATGCGFYNFPDIDPSCATLIGGRLATTILNMQTTYTISGTVSGATQSGVTISCTSTGSTLTTTTASDGTYSFTGLSAGSYTITPSKTGYTFSPTSGNVTITTGNGTQNFTASAVTTGTSYYSGSLSGVSIK